jgi:glycosyltransferase involved in cell wall biosynthesis
VRLQVIGRGDSQAVREYFAPVVDTGIPLEILGWLPYERLVERVSAGAIGLAPLDTESSLASRGKSFGKVLVYLAAGIPVICSNAAEYPYFFRSGLNGYVLPNDRGLWVETIKRLLDDASHGRDLVERANSDFREQLSATAMARKWAEFLTELKQSSDSHTNIQPLAQ